MSKTKKPLYSVMRAISIILFRWLILATAAIILMWFLQYRVNNNNPDAAWSFWDIKPVIFWYSALIIFSILIIVYGVFYGPFRAIGIVFALITIVSYINNTKFDFRGAPLLPEDFQMADQAGTLTSFIDSGELIRVILASILAIGLGFLLDYLTAPYLSYLPKVPLKSLSKKVKTKKAKLAKKKQIFVKVASIVVPRLVIIPIGVLSFFVIAGPIIYHDGGASQKYEWLDGAELIAWNQALNYEQNGFLLGFLYNVHEFSIEKPKEYSGPTVAKLKAEYDRKSEQAPNVNRQSLKDADYNIVIILNESFYDPSLIQQTYHYTGKDPLETFHSIMTNYPSGYMYSPDYGGGTANIEFEADTSLTNYWANTVPYTNILPKINNVISIAKEAKSAGYETTAIHSFSGGMYKRDYVLPKEGFDKFITQDEMNHVEKAGSTGGYINDRSIYQETLDLLENSEQKQLVSVITMQNHAPYYHFNYSDEEYEFAYDDPAVDESTRNIILAYIQSVHYSDTFLWEFLESLSSSNEKTVVLFFGDHAPGIFTELVKAEDSSIANLVHLTPYFIWSNFEPKGKYANSAFGEEFFKKFGGAYINESVEKNVFSSLSKNITLPTTTPNCLTNALYGVLGLKRNAEKMLLEEVCKEAPILSSVYLGNDIPTGKAVEDYSLLNYDILNGKQYWLK